MPLSEEVWGALRYFSNVCHWDACIKICQQLKPKLCLIILFLISIWGVIWEVEINIKSSAILFQCNGMNVNFIFHVIFIGKWTMMFITSNKYMRYEIYFGFVLCTVIPEWLLWFKLLDTEVLIWRRKNYTLIHIHIFILWLCGFIFFAITKWSNAMVECYGAVAIKKDKWQIWN